MRPLPTLAYHPLRLGFLTAFWLVSALAVFTRLDRFSTIFAAAASICLGLALGLLIPYAALAFGPGRRR